MEIVPVIKFADLERSLRFCAEVLNLNELGPAMQIVKELMESQIG